MEPHEIGGPMIDHQKLVDSKGIDSLTPELKKFINETRSKLKGCERRKFMAKVVLLMGRGGQIRAERELGWDRKTIIKGTKELKSGIDCFDNFCGRGRYRVEQKLPNLLDDIKQIVNPVSQCDPTFRTTELYSPLTATEVHRRLLEEKNYLYDQLPTVRTISNKLNQMGFLLKKVTKCKPKKKLHRQMKSFHMSIQRIESPMKPKE
jgi:hypothetical protein